MRKKILILLVITFTALWVTAQNTAPFRIIKTISLPVNGGWDFSAVDEKYNRLFVSHESVVQVVDLKKDSMIGQIENTPGVHGIAFAYDLNKGFTSNGDNNTVTMFNLKTLTVIKSIAISG